MNTRRHARARTTLQPLSTLLGCALTLRCALAVAQPASAAGSAAHPRNPRPASVTGRTRPPGIATRIPPVSLTAQWEINAHSAVSGKPTLSGNAVYWDSWDGNAHATRTDGVEVWDNYIGRTMDNSCLPPEAGPAAGPVIADVVIGGVNTSVAFFGGGDAQVYALKASTGAIIWQRRLGVSPDNFLWASPAFINGSVNIGLSSFGDCPLTQVIKLDPTTGAIQATFRAVPDGCVGGGVWTNLTYDPLGPEHLLLDRRPKPLRGV